MVRQRTKRWGFDLGGEYVLGIAKQEDYGEEVILGKKQKPKKKVSKKTNKANLKSENRLRMIKPWN